MNIKTIDNLKPGVKADLLVSFFFENEKKKATAEMREELGIETLRDNLTVK